MKDPRRRTAVERARCAGARAGTGFAGATLGGAVLVATLLLASRAEAHAIGLSTGEYTSKGARLDAKLTFARGEVATVAPLVDQDADGHVTAAEVASAAPQIRAKVLDRVVVSAGGAPCAGKLTDAALTEQDGLVVVGRWECATSGPKGVDLALLEDLARGHRHLARVVAGAETRDRVLSRDERTFDVPSLPDDPSADAGHGGPPERDPAAATHGASSAPSFFAMGIEHILTGYDHLVFLLGLVLARARLRTLLGVVTAFTVAHSITLALATLGVWTPSAAIVEPAIALSIAYVGVENFFVKDATKRWRITFPFGLVHGFGFAGALSELSLPPAALPGALFTFNLGVEAGQLAALAVVLPVVLALRDRSWFETIGVRVVSGAVAVAGGVWFVARIAF